MSFPQVIAHYRITAKLGEGGMGTVYRATDTRLNREVAIKVLPDALAADPDYLARFTREAQVLASLNHPNIAIIHGVEDRALVMELVPGPTLQEKIAAGPVPLEEALGIAGQIAEALEAAHERGVIHRDLKPGNVKVTPEGVVKVLDFGLAKAADAVLGASSVNSPTLTMRATQAGVILGTAGYMAPEQAVGKLVDKRADIWAFGVVLHELLTGRMLFGGETVSHTLASVLKDPIDTAIPQVPPPIQRLLARCLERNPKNRLRDIGEARITIRDYLVHPAAESKLRVDGAASGNVKGLGYWFPRTLSGMLSLSLVATLAWIFKPAPAPPITRFPFSLGEGQVMTYLGRLGVALSADGTQLVYAANRQLYVRPMAELEAHPIPGTNSEGLATNPVFSPDGKSVVFFASTDLTLKRVSLSGGAPVTIYPAGTALTGVGWSQQGIVFGAFDKGILLVSPNGGQANVLIPARNGEVLGEPQMLPDGQTILFSITTAERYTSAVWDRAQIVAQNLKTGVRKTLIQGGTGARYLPTGHLVYMQSGVLFAVPFNARRLETTGNPVGIVEGVARTSTGAQFAYSASGTLVYMPGPVTASGSGQVVMVRVDRNGEIEPLKMGAAVYSYPRASKDGRRIAVEVDDAKESSISICEIAGNVAPRRLTVSGTGANRYPIWSPDNKRVAFQSDREGDLAIWSQLADGSAPAERLTKPDKGVSHIPDSWSPDGQTLSFTEDKKDIAEIWTYSLRDKKAKLFAAVPGAVLGRSVFSPDGRWIAYQISAQPNSRIYIRSFPPTAVSYPAPEDADSHHPLWSADGKELFYVAGPSMLGSMTVTTQPSVNFGRPVRAPKSGFATSIPGSVRTFDILPDNKHFIGVVPAGQVQSGAARQQEIRVVLNWFEDVKQRAQGQ
jgi:serine/threonine-protein kinase